jgi:hypothetical protein
MPSTCVSFVFYLKRNLPAAKGLAILLRNGTTQLHFLFWELWELPEQPHRQTNRKPKQRRSGDHDHDRAVDAIDGAFYDGGISSLGIISHQYDPSTDNMAQINHVFRAFPTQEQGLARVRRSKGQLPKSAA